MVIDVEKPHPILRNCWDGQIVAFATESGGKTVLCFNLKGQLVYTLDMGSTWHRYLRDIVSIENTQLVVGLVEEFINAGRPYTIPSVYLTLWKLDSSPCRNLQLYLSRLNNLKAFAQRKGSRGNFKTEWPVEVDSDLSSSQLFLCEEDSTIVCCLNGDRRTYVYTFAFDRTAKTADKFMKRLRSSVIDFISSPMPAKYFKADFGNVVLLTADYGTVNVYLARGENLKEDEFGFFKCKKLYYADRYQLVCVNSRQTISFFSFSGTPSLESPKIVRM